MKNYFFLRFFVPRRRESEDARRGEGTGGGGGLNGPSVAIERTAIEFTILVK